jgi:hypothetical protein
MPCGKGSLSQLQIKDLGKQILRSKSNASFFFDKAILMPFHIITREIKHANEVGDILSGHDLPASPFWRRSNMEIRQVGISRLNKGHLAGLPGGGEDDHVFSRINLLSNLYG